MGPFYWPKALRVNTLTIPEIKRLAEAADEAELAALERSLADDRRVGVGRVLEAARSRLAAQAAEEARLASLYDYQQEAAASRGGGVVVGLDEVGRGPLAGPLAVGAVVLPDYPRIPGLNDSKQVPEPQRAPMAAAVKEVAVAWAVEMVPPAEIDALGVTKALKKAFVAAVASIESQGIAVDVVLLDGNPLRFDRRELNVVKGDSRCASIAAASVIAKVERDELMEKLDAEYPGYGFAANKGYGTQAHRDAIHRQGLSVVHRASFCSEFLQQSLF